MTTNSTQPVPEEPPFVDGEIQDERTGQVIQKGIMMAVKEVDLPQPAMKPLSTFDITKVGTLALSEDAIKILEEPLDEADVLIRPEGMLYLPWAWYVKRLNLALGKFQWGLVPEGLPMSRPNGNAVLVVWPHWLVVRGVTIGMSVGETTYYTSNNSMSYADACEGAKSIAMVRNCKLLGMSLELWDHEWGEQWKAKWAEQYTNDKGKKVWRKKAQPSVTKAPEPEDPEIKQGKKNLLAELVPLYFKDSAEVAAKMKELKITYSVGLHRFIFGELIATKVSSEQPKE